MSVMEEQPVRRRRRSFTKEFKADAVALVLDEGRTIVDVATSLGIGERSLGNWVRQARIDRGERQGLTTSEKEELAELRRENSRLRMERDLLICSSLRTGPVSSGLAWARGRSVSLSSASSWLPGDGSVLWSCWVGLLRSCLLGSAVRGPGAAHLFAESRGIPLGVLAGME